jgi:pimeloyl-ACP methyl ester carboxylesterase
MVSDNYFNNQRLPRFDHAELLLGLARLNQQGRNVMMVLHADAAPWYAVLWRAAWMPLTALALLLALLLWRAARRFGPMLPEPATERRSLIEHIEASGNWLWRAKGGRDVLLAAARQETLALLRRRAPELHPLGDDEKAARLARLCNAQLIDMRSALHGPAASQPAAFTRQIQLLQQVRIHYERQ